MHAYRKNEKINLSTYYSDVIGVTTNPGQRSVNLIFWMDHKAAPYVITKPLHTSQMILREDGEGVIFNIKVVPNFELEREILGFGARIKILSPRNVKNRIAEQLRTALKYYE